MKIRNLLRLEPNAGARATDLYRLVEPVCTSAEERAKFIEVAKWSSSFATERNEWPRVLALDTIEHVATACFRNYQAATFELLKQAALALPGQARLDLLAARLLATAGRLKEALARAKAVQAAGSNHAIALVANLQAKIARETTLGYTPGMLQTAIETVTVEPESDWQLVDLMAVLSTRARLLSERAVWEPPKTAHQTLAAVERVYQRLSVDPFIEATRTRALDVLCFNAQFLGRDPLKACARAAKESKNLGAAHVSGTKTLGKDYDSTRKEALLALPQELEKLPKGTTVLFVARGDESELIEWALPAALFLGSLRSKQPELIVVDRTQSARTSKLLARILTLANVPVRKRIHAPRDPLAMPCVAALLAKRRTPAGCPFEKVLEDHLAALPALGAGILVGRDLDAEIDDLGLYALRTVVLSFRRSRAKKVPTFWLKSLSDVYMAKAPRKPASAQGPR